MTVKEFPEQKMLPIPSITEELNRRILDSINKVFEKDSDTFINDYRDHVAKGRAEA